MMTEKQKLFCKEEMSEIGKEGVGFFLSHTMLTIKMLLSVN